MKFLIFAVSAAFAGLATTIYCLPVTTEADWDLANQILGKINITIDSNFRSISTVAWWDDEFTGNIIFHKLGEILDRINIVVDLTREMVAQKNLTVDAGKYRMSMVSALIDTGFDDITPHIRELMEETRFKIWGQMLETSEQQFSIGRDFVDALGNGNE